MRPDEPISRIMTEAVVVIEADRPVSEVLDCFFQYPIHHLPVVRDGRLAGMLSSADVMKLECFLPKSTTDRASYLDERLTIEQLMRTPVVSLRANASLGDAAEQLIESGVHAAPIVDEDDRVLGIVTTTDIMRSLLRGPPRQGTVPATAQQPAAADGRIPRRARLPPQADRRGVRNGAEHRVDPARGGAGSTSPRQDDAVPRAATRLSREGI